MRLWALLTVLLTLLSTNTLATANESLDFQPVVAEISRQGDRLLIDYSADTALSSSDAFSALYFDHFEESGMEMAIGLVDPGLKSQLESQFSQVIGQAARGNSKADVNAAWLILKSSLQQVADNQAANDGAGYWSLFTQSLLIIIREGFEAMLVITALTTYLRRQNAGQQLPVIYYGVGFALIMSLLTAYLLTQVYHIAGAKQEALEGLTMLLASAVLFYVSYWLISKSESTRWQAYINGKIDSALSTGSALTLGFAAFLAVYREGAETVLFYQAIAGQSNGEFTPIILGFFLGLAVLAVLYFLMRSASFRLPIGLFFGLTAGLLYYLAISFAGGGVLELQEAGWLSITPVAGVPTITWLGLYPSQETLLTQAVLVIPLLIALIFWLPKLRKQNIEKQP